MRVKIPAQIRPYAGGNDAIDLTGADTVGDLIHKLGTEYPALKERLVDESGELRRFVNVYVDGEDVRFLDSLETPLSATSVVSILPAVAGGAGSSLP